MEDGPPIRERYSEPKGDSSPLAPGDFLVDNEETREYPLVAGSPREKALLFESDIPEPFAPGTGAYCFVPTKDDRAMARVSLFPE
jgi:hypothetical protein